ncbi:hypothetical protein [Halarchaeum sp. P4]
MSTAEDGSRSATERIVEQSVTLPTPQVSDVEGVIERVGDVV